MENSADTDVRGRMSFGTPDDDGDSRRSMNDERTSNFNGVRDIRNTTNELEQRLN